MINKFDFGILRLLILKEIYLLRDFKLVYKERRNLIGKYLVGSLYLYFVFIYYYKIIFICVTNKSVLQITGDK